MIFRFRGRWGVLVDLESGQEETTGGASGWFVRFTRVNVPIWPPFCRLQPAGVALSGIIHTNCTAKEGNK